MQEIFYDKSYNNNSILRKPSTKFISSGNSELNNIVNALHKIEPEPLKPESNLNKKESIAYSELKKLSCETLEFKKADKSDTWVVLNKNDYRNLILKEHLLTESYEKASIDSNKKVHRKLINLVEKNKEILTKDEIKFLTDPDWKEAHFYGLPKIHKCLEINEKVKEGKSDYVKMNLPLSLKTRPICGGPKAVTQGSSELLHKILSPLVPCMKSYIKDEWDFVRRFPNKISYKAVLLSCDIVSLYSSIPLDLGLEALEYWIDKLRSEIPARFTKDFILNLARFVLDNNFMEFDGDIYHQMIGTSMGSIFAPDYACLTVGYLEETKLYPSLRSHFDEDTCLQIIENFFRFMDDGTTLFPLIVDLNLFLFLLNSMHPALKYTVEKSEYIEVNGKLIQKLIFLALVLYLDSLGNIWTDVHYKSTNTHEYLHYESFHRDHVKNNIPYTLAKRIVVFTSNGETTRRNLSDLTTWLNNCGYPESIIQKGIHDALLQGPANKKEEKKLIPLISTNYSNYSNGPVLHAANSMIKNCKDDRMVKAFKDVQFIHSYKQPANLLRTLSHSKLLGPNETKQAGVFHCSHGGCKICRLYLQTGTKVPLSNGTIWEVKCYASCSSLNTLYFHVCNSCSVETYSGKAVVYRGRTNTHMSQGRLGGSSNKFDMHVHKCYKDSGKPFVEPLFTSYILMVCNSYHKLLAYESMLQAKGIDTLNR